MLKELGIGAGTVIVVLIAAYYTIKFAVKNAMEDSKDIMKKAVKKAIEESCDVITEAVKKGTDNVDMPFEIKQVSYVSTQ